MKKSLILTLLIITSLFLNFGFTQAAGLVPCGGPEEPACTVCHFFVLINNIVEFIMFQLAPVIAVLMIVIGGVLLFFAEARPGMLIKAKQIFTSTAIGLIIIFSAWIIVNTILTKIGIVSSPSLLQWYNISC